MFISPLMHKYLLIFVVHSPYSHSTEYDNKKLGKAYCVTCVTPENNWLPTKITLHC
jgi:hypothetical protein